MLKSIFFVLFVGVVSFLPLRNIAYGNEKLLVMTENFPPYNYIEDGELKGFAVDIVNSIQARLELSTEIKVYPWLRGYHFLQTQKNTALFTTARSKDREELFNWVGPIAEVKLGFYGLSSRHIKLESLDDAKDLSIAVQANGSPPAFLTRSFKRNMDTSPYPLTNLKKLIGGRNDLWFSNAQTVAGTLKELGRDPSEVEIVFEISKSLMYIAFNKKTSDQVIKRWQETYDQMIREGLVWDILAKHNMSILYPRSLERTFSRTPK